MLIGKYFTSYADEIKGMFFNGFIDAVQHIDNNSDCAFYVITPDSQFEGSWNVSEILTLYAQDVDAEYFQGKYKDDNGLLYSDKYLYYNASDINAQIPISAKDPVAYVITPDDVGLFPPEDYVITEFNYFYTAIPVDNAF